ncbi:MAG: hypothetical protein ABS862_03060 [Carnobacterium inhibens]
MKKAPRLTRSVEMIHLFVVGSVHYWGALIRSGLIYGFADAARSALSFLQERVVLAPIDAPAEQDRTRKSIPFGKGLSFVWTVLLNLCLASLLCLYMGLLHTISSFLVVTSLTLFSLYHTFLVLAISLYEDKQDTYNGKWLYAYTLDYMIRNPFKNLFVLMLTWSAMGVAYFNLVLFFFLVPSLYWMMIQKGLQVKVKE